MGAGIFANSSTAEEAYQQVSQYVIKSVDGREIRINTPVSSSTTPAKEPSEMTPDEYYEYQNSLDKERYGNY